MRHCYRSIESAIHIICYVIYASGFGLCLVSAEALLSNILSFTIQMCLLNIVSVTTALCAYQLMMILRAKKNEIYT